MREKQRREAIGEERMEETVAVKCDRERGSKEVWRTDVGFILSIPLL